VISLVGADLVHNNIAIMAPATAQNPTQPSAHPPCLPSKTNPNTPPASKTNHATNKPPTPTRARHQVRLALRADGGGLRKRLREMGQLTGAGQEGLWLTLEETVNEITKRQVGGVGLGVGGGVALYL